MVAEPGKKALIFACSIPSKQFENRGPLAWRLAECLVE
jgi:hypothetical protein